MQGEPLRDVTFPVHTISQATALCWHPERRQVVGQYFKHFPKKYFIGQRFYYFIRSLDGKMES